MQQTMAVNDRAPISLFRLPSPLSSLSQEKLGTAEAAKADLELRLRRAQSAPITLQGPTRPSRVKTEAGMSPVESDGSDAEGGKRGSDDSDDADDDEDPRARLVMSLSERIAEMDEVCIARHGHKARGK